MDQVLYEFLGFQLDITQRILTRNGKIIPLPRKAIDVLILLVQNHGRVIDTDYSMKTLWPHTFVEESNLSHNIFVLRKVLGDDGQNGKTVIQTIPRRGYRFAAEVKEVSAPPPDTDQTIGQADNAPGDQSNAAKEYWNQNSPFRSLRAFEPEDSWLFFGRESEIEDLLGRLSRSPVLAVVGNSGSGKSSLIRAGLIPAVQQGRLGGQSSPVVSWRIVLCRPSSTPFDFLSEILPGALAPELSIQEQADFIAYCKEKLPADETALRNAISAIVFASAGKSDSRRILLVVDQFEELFTLNSNPDTQQRYIASLLSAHSLDGAVPVHVVLILRADFYANCLDHPELSKTLESNLYNLPRMSHEQLRESVEKRLTLARGQAEPGLIDSLLSDVGAEPGNLALLEHALGQLWEKCGGYGCTLTNQAYSEIGRLRGALGRHADAVYASLGDERLQQLAQKIFLELVHLGEDTGTRHSDDTRRRVAKKDLLLLGEDAEEMEQLLARLASRRLISIGGSEHAPVVEVSHEMLIREWPALREWIAAHRDLLRLERRLLQAAEEWEEVERDPGALLQGARLAQAEEWLARSPKAPPRLQEFIQASSAARYAVLAKEASAAVREQLAHEKNVSMLRPLGIALILLFLVGAGVVWNAKKERAPALLSQIEHIREQDQGQALDVAMRGWQMTRTAELKFAASREFPQLAATLYSESPIRGAAFSPDGERVLVIGRDHLIRIYNKGGRLLTQLSGHQRRIIYAEFSHDSQLIVTTSEDLTVRVWNAADGGLRAILLPRTLNLTYAHFSADDRRVITPGQDNTALVWNTDGKLLHVLQGHTSAVANALFSPHDKFIITTSRDKTARVWSGADYALIATLQDHNHGLTDAAFSPDSQYIVTVGEDETADVWNSSGQLLSILQHDGSVLDATFSPDGRLIATASMDHTARIWDSANGHLLRILRGHTSAVQDVRFSGDGRLLFTDSSDSTARVWNVFNGYPLVTLNLGSAADAFGLAAFITPVAAFSPDGRLVAEARFEDSELRIWNIAAAGDAIAVFSDSTGPALWSPDGQSILANYINETDVLSSSEGRIVRKIEGNLDYLYGRNFSPDGHTVVTKVDDKARIWNFNNGALVATLRGHRNMVSEAQFSPDGHRVLTSEDHKVRVWDSRDGHLLTTLQGDTGIAPRAQFSPDSRQIITTGLELTARVWSSDDGRLLFTLEGHTDTVNYAEFSPDGRHIITAGADGTARVWNSADGRLLFTLQVMYPEFSPDGRRIITPSRDYTARIGNSADENLPAILGHSNSVLRATFSPDSRLIVTVSNDRTARIWNSADGRLLAILEGHSGDVLSASFSPDGRRIVTASADHTARVWDSLTGHLLAVLKGHSSAVESAVFSPDGQRILTFSKDGIRVWRIITLEEFDRMLAN